MQKAGEQGKDDSIKQFSIQPHLHIFNGGKICRVKLCTELFYAIIHNLFPCFLLICYSPHLVTFLVVLGRLCHILAAGETLKL